MTIAVAVVFVVAVVGVLVTDSDVAISLIVVDSVIAGVFVYLLLLL